jgi:hypothetical protein
MTCEEARETLDDVVDEALAPEAAARVEAHLAACATCRAEVEGLRAILQRARTLPRERAPARDLWPGIARTIAGRSAGRPAGVGRVVLFAAAAALLLVIGAAGSRALFTGAAAPVVVAPGDLGLPLAEERQYVEAVASLRRALDDRKAALSPEALQVVEGNLKTIDEALRQVRLALREDPGNALLGQMLSSTNQQKVELLENVLALVEGR